MNTGLWIYLVFVVLILLFAIISNFMVIVAVVQSRAMRTVTHVLIANLAFSDILFGGVFLPTKLHDISHPGDYFEGIFLCKFIHAFPTLMITGSCYTLVCISYERRRAIMESHKRQMSVTEVLKYLPALWICSFLVAFPTIFEYTVETVSRNNTLFNSTSILICDNKYFPRYLTLTNCVFVVVFSFVIPLILIFNNYTKTIIFIIKRYSRVSEIPSLTERATVSAVMSIARTTVSLEKSWTSRVNMDNSTNLENTHIYKNRMKIIKMLVLVAVTFAVCWIPYFVLYIYTKLSGTDASLHSTSYATLVLNVLMAVSSAYNVILYVIFNSAFREAFKNMLRCSCKEGTRDKPGPTLPTNLNGGSKTNSLVGNMNKMRPTRQS